MLVCLHRDYGEFSQQSKKIAGSLVDDRPNYRWILRMMSFPFPSRISSAAILPDSSEINVVYLMHLAVLLESDAELGSIPE